MIDFRRPEENGSELSQLDDHVTWSLPPQEITCLDQVGGPGILTRLGLIDDQKIDPGENLLQFRTRDPDPEVHGICQHEAIGSLTLGKHFQLVDRRHVGQHHHRGSPPAWKAG